PGLATELVPARLREVLLPARFPSKRRRYEQPIDVEALRGAALFVRRAAVDAIGPLCEDYFFFLEETDWCWRLRRGGWRVRLVPGAPVVHLLGASSKRRHPAATRIEYHRSLYRFLREHRGHAVALAVAVLRAARLLGSVLLLAAPAAASAPARARLVERFQVLLWHLRGCPAGAGLAALDGGPRTREASPAPEAGKQEARANASAKGCA
ncbi:MAG: hypothetical protein O7A09_13045, partial [Proteobacteria bacterium]|nr:hypothetical protein [Pseudomonadota bacterium]